MYIPSDTHKKIYNACGSSIILCPLLALHPSVFLDYGWSSRHEMEAKAQVTTAGLPPPWPRSIKAFMAPLSPRLTTGISQACGKRSLLFVQYVSLYWGASEYRWSGGDNICACVWCGGGDELPQHKESLSLKSFPNTQKSVHGGVSHQYAPECISFRSELCPKTLDFVQYVHLCKYLTGLGTHETLLYQKLPTHSVTPATSKHTAR